MQATQVETFHGHVNGPGRTCVFEFCPVNIRSTVSTYTLSFDYGALFDMSDVWRTLFYTSDGWRMFFVLIP